ncbi:hypothetical protein [Candidatus Poriferisodalis sp.]|uniref:hypothetical protein n=1 Tax=Candidatus Poriferisodalis sp. TaxID=3101277 RepID=UPI003AF6A2A2
MSTTSVSFRTRANDGGLTRIGEATHSDPVLTNELVGDNLLTFSESEMVTTNLRTMELAARWEW